MTLETFTKLIDAMSDYDDKIHKLYLLGIDAIHMNDDYYRFVIHPLCIEAFGEQGLDWISWFLYERPKHERDTPSATDKDGKPICYDIPSLFELVNSYKKDES